MRRRKLRCRQIGLRLLDLIWDPQPKRTRPYRDARRWQRRFRKDLDSVDPKGLSTAVDFLYGRALDDVEQCDKNYESLRSKCFELIKLDTALAGALLALIRFLKSDELPFIFTGASITFLIFSMAIQWRAMSGFPRMTPIKSEVMADWERRNRRDLALIKYHFVANSRQVVVFNDYVNSWISKRLTAGWLITIAALIIAAADLLPPSFFLF